MNGIELGRIDGKDGRWDRWMDGWMVGWVEGMGL